MIPFIAIAIAMEIADFFFINVDILKNALIRKLAAYKCLQTNTWNRHKWQYHIRAKYGESNI